MHDSADFGSVGFGNTELETILMEANQTLENFASYYAAQGIYPAEESQDFLRSMKQASPIDFRVNPSTQLSSVLQETLEAVAANSSNAYLQRCAWYPRGLAWRFFPDRAGHDAPWLTDLLVWQPPSPMILLLLFLLMIMRTML